MQSVSFKQLAHAVRHGYRKARNGSGSPERLSKCLVVVLREAGQVRVDETRHKHLAWQAAR